MADEGVNSCYNNTCFIVVLTRKSNSADAVKGAWFHSWLYCQSFPDNKVSPFTELHSHKLLTSLEVVHDILLGARFGF